MARAPKNNGRRVLDARWRGTSWASWRRGRVSDAHEMLQYHSTVQYRICSTVRTAKIPPSIVGRPTTALALTAGQEPWEHRKSSMLPSRAPLCRLSLRSTISTTPGDGTEISVRDGRQVGGRYCTRCCTSAARHTLFTVTETALVACMHVCLALVLHCCTHVQ